MKYLVDNDMLININLNNRITCIIGPNNSGKTFFFNKLCNRINNKSLFIDDVNVKQYDISYLKDNIAVALNDINFNGETVFEEMYYYLEKMGVKISVALSKIENMLKMFNVHHLLESRIDNLTISEKMLIRMLSVLVLEPKILGIDDLLIYLSKEDKEKLIKYIKKNKINFVYSTSNQNEILLSDDLIILNNLKAVSFGETKSVLKDNNILAYLGLKLPFQVELSENLKLYGLVNKTYFDNKKLVDKIWK